jgi:cell division protein FtsL
MFQTTSITLPRLATQIPRRPPLLPTLGFIAMLLLLSLFVVWSRLQVLQLEYGISSVESKIRSGQQEASRLRLEAASLRHPGRIEQVAMSELGLRLPNPSQMISVR